MPRGATAKLGDRRKSPNGYWYVRKEYGWELEHRLVVQEKLGRELKPDEFVKFADGNKENLDPDNLIVQMRGKTSLKRRLAQVEGKIQELVSLRDEIRDRIARRDSLGS